MDSHDTSNPPSQHHSLPYPPPPPTPLRVPPVAPPPPPDNRESPLKWLLLLLVVGGIFLAAFFPFGRQSGYRITDSRVLAKGVADAVTQFYGDYNRLPRPASASANASAGNDIDTDTSAAEGMIRILSGREEPGEAATVQNSRKTNYLEGMKAAKSRTGVRKAEAEGSDKWVSGLVVEGGALETVDGWGAHYRIRMDSNYDGEIMNPNSDEAGEGRQKLPNRVIVWSAGKDGKWETWGDNIKSWD